MELGFDKLELEKSLGLRAKNPLCIRYDSRNKWQGQNGHLKGFCRFVDYSYGYRAALLIILKYINVYGLRSVKDIIFRWSPASENDAEGYVDTVERRLYRMFLHPFTLPDGSVQYSSVTANDDLVDWCKANEVRIEVFLGMLILLMSEVECGLFSAGLRKYMQLQASKAVLMVKQDLVSLPHYKVRF